MRVAPNDKPLFTPLFYPDITSYVGSHLALECSSSALLVTIN